MGKGVDIREREPDSSRVVLLVLLHRRLLGMGDLECNSSLLLVELEETKLKLYRRSLNPKEFASDFGKTKSW
jgi:hypothetical protein